METPGPWQVTAYQIGVAKLSTTKLVREHAGGLTYPSGRSCR